MVGVEMGARGARAGSERYLGVLFAEAQRTRRPIALDSSLIIDFFTADERIADLTGLILVQSGVPIVISTVSVTEATTRPAREGNAQQVAAIHGALVSMPHT